MLRANSWLRGQDLFKTLQFVEQFDCSIKVVAGA